MDKRDRFAEGFSARELLLLIWLASLFLMIVGLQFDIMDEKFLFVNIPNEKISLQHEMQNMRIAWSLKIVIVSVIQIVTFHMNSTLGCTTCIFDVSATYLTGKNRIRIKRNTHLVSMLIVIWPYGSSYCKLLLCYENLSILMWTKYKESVKEFQSK